MATSSPKNTLNSNYELSTINYQLSITHMAYVKYSQGIDYISGALNHISGKGQHSHEKMLIATHRQAETTNPHCNRIFLREKVQRVSQPSANEMAQRSRFAAVAREVSNRRQNLSRVTADQAAFLAQRDQPGGKRTMRAYLWSLELAAYDANH